MNYPTYTPAQVATIVASIPTELLPKMKRAYTLQKSLGRRGHRADMLLSFNEWVCIWFDSGHWDKRGRRNGDYQMCRQNDDGPYTMGSVRIDTRESNSEERNVSDKWRESARKQGLANSIAVISIDMKTGEECLYPSTAEAARKLGIAHGNISSALSGRRKHASGFFWKYA